MIRYDAYDAGWFRNLHSVYSKYQRLNKEELTLHHLVPARLLYGELDVAVRMNFLKDVRECSETDMNDIDVMKHVAAAVRYLGRNRLLFTDLRPPNILVGPDVDQVYLVDYDDMRVTEAPLLTAEDFTKAMDSCGFPQQNNYMNENNEVFQECLAIK